MPRLPREYGRNDTMDRIAGADAVERKLVFEATAECLGTTLSVVEKDFWVCYILEHLFHR